MKIMHLSDLHLGKRVNEYSMTEDQRYILGQIAEIARDQADAVMLCGDIYDKPIPPVEAVTLFDDFLRDLSDCGLPVLVISGNHDSAERLAFGSGLMERSGVYIASGIPREVVLTDQYGEVHFRMMPFLKPSMIRHLYPDADISSYQEGVEYVLRQFPVSPSGRNVILAHQNVTGALRSESEDIPIGGIDNIDASIFAAYDYAALGHIHRPQNLTAGNMVRYCGTPLKYSFSEAGHEKSVTMVELREKGQVLREEIPLVPLRDLREIRGTYEQLTLRKNYEGTNVEDYLHITLTDEEDIIDVMTKLRVVYPNIMRLDYDNLRTRNQQEVQGMEEAQDRSPEELVEEFYQLQNNQEPTGEQKAFLAETIRNIWEENA